MIKPLSIAVILLVAGILYANSEFIIPVPMGGAEKAGQVLDRDMNDEYVFVDKNLKIRWLDCIEWDYSGCNFSGLLDAPLELYQRAGCAKCLTERGLRSDGVIVWRKFEEAVK